MQKEALVSCRAVAKRKLFFFPVGGDQKREREKKSISPFPSLSLLSSSLPFSSLLLLHLQLRQRRPLDDESFGADLCSPLCHFCFLSRFPLPRRRHCRRLRRSFFWPRQLDLEPALAGAAPRRQRHPHGPGKRNQGTKALQPGQRMVIGKKSSGGGGIIFFSGKKEWIFVVFAEQINKIKNALFLAPPFLFLSLSTPRPPAPCGAAARPGSGPFPETS